MVLEKVSTVQTNFQRGTKLHISHALGVAQPNPSNDEQPVVAKLAVDVDFSTPGNYMQRTLTDTNGVEHIALLVPVIIM